MNLANSIYAWYRNDKAIGNIKQLSDNQIFNLTNDINSLFSEIDFVESKVSISLPRLVVIGTQSSGKSSVLNSIMAMDILPTGKNMVTRTPLDIRLHKIESTEAYFACNGYVEFGEYINGEWIINKKINIKTPIPQENEIDEIRNYIKIKTNESAGSCMNISPNPIILQIYSQYVPNLSLVDLPGLTIVPCIDKGQPEDIKEKIENLALSYIKNEKTIVLLIMQSRNDIETDLGMALIKKTKNKKIIGVLTKPDLMNPETHIGDYLLNNISKNLMLEYGYFVIKNRNNIELTESIIKGFELEKQYFLNHIEYKKQIYTAKIGTQNLTNNISTILLSSITDLLPSALNEIITLETQINDKIEKFGIPLPQTKEGKLAFINKYVSNFNSKFAEGIESRNINFNTGKSIKDTFTTYKKELSEIKPFFDKNIYNQEYFSNIISSFEGNHMTFHVPLVQVLETCLTDEKHKPIMKLQTRSLKCVDMICDVLINSIKNILNQDEFSRYSLLANHILIIISDDLIPKTKIKAKEQINNLLKYEIDYIWTDSPDFSNSLDIIELTTSSQKNQWFDNKNESIRNFLEKYFCIIKNIICHYIPKIIMSEIVKTIQKNLLTFLLHTTVTDDKISLIKEDDEIEKQRKYYNNIKERINAIKKLFSKNNIIQ
jgi:GTP-binding protein EngB required for normal cell division